MKLSDIKPNIESSGELEEKFFSIGDTGMIFDILRNKMYSNPILAICREYSCNARDAHREVGKPEVPIHIHLPNSLESFYKIKDFGPGISPDRMENIFIKYAASTKRQDNTQTGGFGLGCKSAFSYSDTFSIITNFNGIQYNYSCFIDETKVGKLALFSESPTNEPNGTEIIIPVKSTDFSLFKEATVQSMSHWNIKPVVKGDYLDWETFPVAMEGKDWFIVKSRDYYSNYNNIKIIIDGIEYPLEKRAIEERIVGNIINYIKGNLYINFGIGELNLSASREQIYLDDNTKYWLASRILSISEEIIKKLNDKFDSYDNLWEANIAFKDEAAIFYDPHKIQKFCWRGTPLSYGAINNLKFYVYHFSKYNPARRFASAPVQEKIRKSRTCSITFNADSVLCLNDLDIKEPGPSHIKKIFDSDPNVKSVQVICPNDNFSIQMINDSYHADLMEAKLLSSFTQASTRKRASVTSRFLYFKYEPAFLSFRQISYSSVKEDKNKKVMCQLNRDIENFRYVKLTNSITLSNNMVNSLATMMPNVSFYGVDANLYKDKKNDKELKDFQLIEDFLTKEVFNNKKINYVELKLASNTYIDLNRYLLNSFDKLEDLIKNKDSAFLKKIRLYNKINSLKDNLNLLNIYESINKKIEQSEVDNFLLNNQDYNLAKIDEEIDKKYPLLDFLDYYNNRVVPHLIDYINLVDSNYI